MVFAVLHRLKPKALPDVHHAATKPRLYRVHRRLELRRQLLPAPAVVVGKQHKFLAIWLEAADAFQKALQFFRHFPACQRIRAVGGDFHRRRLFLDREFGSLAHEVDGPVTGDRRHPRDRRRQTGIELSRAIPNLDVRLLNDLLSEVLPAQDTEYDAIEFRPRRGVEALESILVPLCNGGDQPDQLSWRQHSASPKVAMPDRLRVPAAVLSLVA